MLCPNCFFIWQLLGSYLKNTIKKTSTREDFLWCIRIDELLNSIVDETSDMDERE